MKSIIFIEKGKAAFIEEEKPVCQKDTVLLKTIFSGVTNGTERNVLVGGNYGGWHWPSRVGYQLVSEVVECGVDITNFKVGDIVYTGTGFGHIEYHLAKESDLIIKLPEGFDLQAAALLGVTSVPFHDARRADVRVDDNVLVFGAGLIGQFAVQASLSLGAKVTIADIDCERLALAKSLGADEVIDLKTDAGKELLQKNKPYTVVFECSGADVLGQIIGTNWGNGIIGHRARVLIIAGRTDVIYNFNAGQGAEVSVLHVSHFDQSDLEQVVRLVSKGVIKIRPLIKDIVPFKDAISIYDTLRDNPNKLLGTVFDWR